MKVYQPGTHLTDKRGARVEDWSWAQTKRRLTALYRLARPYKRAHDDRDRASLLGATAVSLAPPYLVGQHGRRGHATGKTVDPRLARRGCSSPSGVLGIGFSYAQTYFTGWTGERMLADLRNHLFRHLQRLSLGFYERNRAGVIISRLTNDVEALDQLVTDGVTSLVQNTLTLVGTAVVLFFLDWRLALATLTVIPLAERRHGDLPQALGPRVPRRPRDARRRHGDARRGHRRACASCRRSRARRRRSENFRQVSDTLPRSRTCRQSC